MSKSNKKSRKSKGISVISGKSTSVVIMDEGTIFVPQKPVMTDSELVIGLCDLMERSIKLLPQGIHKLQLITDMEILISRYKIGRTQQVVENKESTDTPHNSR